MTPVIQTLHQNANHRPRKPPRSARIALNMLAKLDSGQLSITGPTGESWRFGNGDQTAAIDLANWNVFNASLRSGDIGFAESYIRRDWSSDSLVNVLNLLIANRAPLEQAIYGSWFGRLAHRITHLLNRNTKRGAKRNIHSHYDLGNDFYSLWLDPSMTYSSALFTSAQQTLEQAQAEKYQRMLRQTGCAAGDKILEIGCGWGGFAQVAVQAGLSVTGLTLSIEQQYYAQQRLQGLEANTQSNDVNFELRDYRDETGRFDGIVSIEMFEAVGQQYWPQYFESIRRCLKPGGRAVVQTITIDESLFERYQGGTDFIQQYIFPGGMLPSIERFTEQAGKQGLIVVDQHTFGADYAKTLRLWRNSFMSRLDEVQQLGFDDRFIRTWEFYLAYCEAAFTGGNTNVCQFTLQTAD
ncbi:MAG: cyclopropane-fatty-acyl-phospholipid synthase family protein [Burkholderiaceae bacterium]